ncbi:galactose mutarotase [Microbacterium sp. Root1433D1]|uniref:aldose 1-epimerase family protein n=1 Tax=Microbacterium sp. Root1433D1 TaxID=1736463 RepID=UPI0006FA6F0D|nr:aldose 1-epimerase family protein [Microbacterium sp. Root1433D1]KQY77775.1 galactose mutarotase [Microbacterium sp. Root1433D1]
MTALPLSGRQLRIAAHGYRAEIASIGATLRTLTSGGRDLVVPFEPDSLRPGYRGATLAPWPNRIVGGRYRYAGREHQLPLTEPERAHALHGLLTWVEFEDRLVLDDRVVLVAVILPQAGYPFRVEVEVDYRLDAGGLHQTVTAHNVGADAAPWGTGPHPYLVAGPGAVDDWYLSLPASEVLTVTPDRLSPVTVEPVSQHPQWDFRTSRRIDDVFIDHAFTGLARTAGVAEVRLLADDGHGVGMEWDDRCPWVQVHTADTPTVAETHRIGLAVEPMTCPPDAFNSGVDLVTLAPGATYAASWRIFAVPGAPVAG